ncbi:MAG: hypothetical protein LBD98_03135 [Endomicrobium sp.]|jgi:hypothetical protein|nr:hypothetical protein [Endomicrobium sp.]
MGILADKIIEIKNKSKNRVPDAILASLKKVSPGFMLAESVKNNPKTKAFGATVLSEALFDAPRRNSDIDSMVRSLEESSPRLSSGAKILGTVASLPVAGAAAKGISKVPKIASLLKKGMSKNRVLSGALAGSGYGTLFGAGKSIGGIDDEPMVQGMIKEAGKGALIGGAGSALIRKLATPKSVRNKIVQDLSKKINPKNLEEIIKIRSVHPSKSDKRLYNLITLGDEGVQRVANAAVLKNEKARGLIQKEKDYFKSNQFDELKRKLYQRLRSQDYRAMPSPEEYVASYQQRLNKEAEPYFRHFEKGNPIELNARLKGDPDFKLAHKKAVARINDALKKEGKIKDNSPQVLHATKMNLHDLVEKYAKNAPSLSRNAEIAATELRNILGKASDSYNKAMELTQKGFKVRDAAKLGKEMTKNPSDSIKLAMEKMSPGEKESFKLGYINDLIDQSTKAEMASKADMRSITSQFRNEQKRRSLKELLGEKVSSDLLADTDRLFTGSKNLQNLLGGSPTAKNLEDLAGVGTLAAQTIVHPKRSFVRYLGKGIDKMLTNNPKKETIKIKMLLDPERLKSRLNKIKESSKDFSLKSSDLAKKGKKVGTGTAAVSSHIEYDD